MTKDEQREVDPRREERTRERYGDESSQWKWKGAKRPLSRGRAGSLIQLSNETIGNEIPFDGKA